MDKATFCAIGYLAFGAALLCLMRWHELRITHAPRTRSMLGAVLCWVAAIALLSASASAQKIVAENVADHPQRTWTFVGLPDDQVPQWPGCSCCPMQDDAASDDHTACGWRYVPAPHGVWLLVDLPATTRAVVELEPQKWTDADAAGSDADSAPPFWSPFELARPIVDTGILNLVPRFWARALDGTEHWSEPPQFWPPGAPRPPTAFVRQLEDNPAVQVWHLRTRIRPLAITVDWWARIGSTCSTVEWTCHAVYGDVGTPGQPLSVQLGEFGLQVGAQPVVDYARRINAPAATPADDADRAVPTAWRQRLHPASWWSRASRVETRGALLTAPDPARRQGRPIGAVYAHWDGSWLALGQVPKAPPDAVQRSAGRRATYLSPPAGNPYDQRPAAQPKASGTTGEQDGFGFSWGEEVVTQLSCWAIHDLLYHAQAYAMRPTSNRELNGDPIRAADHPGAVTTNQRPDDRFSDADPLGWYWPPNSGTIPYSWPGTGYSTSDDQHRDDGLLHALIALTRDPALCSIVEDQIQVQLLNLPGREGGIGSPRSMRVLLANVNQAWLGFDGAAELVAKTVAFCHRNAGYKRIAQDPAHPVRILDTGLDEAKYGWRYADGSVIRGWQPWQNTIAAGAFYAASLVSQDPSTVAQARELAYELARTCIDQALYEWQGTWQHAYAHRWRTEDPGSTHPPTSWFPSQPNYDLFTTGATQRWTLAAPRILLALAPDDPLAPKARALIGRAANWYDSRWWAIGAER